MKHYLWILSRKYKEFSNNNIVKAINKSFIFNLFKALSIIMFVLLLIFSVKPKKAYVYGELDSVSYVDCKTELLEVSSIISDYVSISGNNEIIIDLNGLSINGIDYIEGDYLVISPEEYKNFREGYISFFGTIDKVNFYDVNSFSFQNKIIYSDTSEYFFVGEQHLKIYSENAYIMREDGKKDEIDCTQDLILMDTLTKNTINEYKRVLEEITNDDGTVKKEYEKEYQLYTNYIDRLYNEEKYPVKIYIKNSYEDSNLQLENCFVDFENVESKYVRSCKIVANGNFAISYTPNANEYTLKNQEICLNSSESLISFSYDAKNNFLFISGYVNDTVLSRMSLFPDFWNWYFSNIYMIPLTLISAVFTALSMMKSLRK